MPRDFASAEPSKSGEILYVFPTFIRHSAEDDLFRGSLVMDNLNTHSIASLYATFPPQHARDLAERLEIHYTPKHGSWLDIAEIELSALGRQCIANNRIPDLPSLRSLLEPWAVARNIAQKGVDWHFTTDDARTKLKHLYPIIKI